MVGLLQSARVAGISGSVLALGCLFGIIVCSGYLATTKSATVMSRARKAYWTLLAFLILAVLMGTTGSAYYGGFPV